MVNGPDAEPPSPAQSSPSPTSRGSVDPWTAALGTRRGSGLDRVAEPDVVGAPLKENSLLDEALALLDDLREHTSADALVSDVTKRAAEQATRVGMLLDIASSNEDDSTLIAQDASSRRLVGTLFAIRPCLATGWCFNFQLDADAVAGRPLP